MSHVTAHIPLQYTIIQSHRTVHGTVSVDG